MTVTMMIFMIGGGGGSGRSDNWKSGGGSGFLFSEWKKVELTKKEDLVLIVDIGRGGRLGCAGYPTTVTFDGTSPLAGLVLTAKGGRPGGGI